ncbi:unnamed protein product [Durusdinium trenchii]|uniref:Uncharacterized protein n=1 Tax=Durusdinium trenchii TaxID=1381693 RepID=A0ABP0HK96_9DINO
MAKLKLLKKPARGSSSKKPKAKGATVASGRRARWQVFSGQKQKTVGRLKKAQLTKNRRGKVVAKKASEAAKNRYASSKIKTWYESVKDAREAPFCHASRRQLVAGRWAPWTAKVKPSLARPCC